MGDGCNWYVSSGTNGGLATLILFLSIIVCGYKIVGRSRKLSQSDSKNESLIWALGATLFANTVGFFGDFYYDQSVIGWYAVLAMLSVLPAIVAQEARSQAQLGTVQPAAAVLPVGAVTASIHP